MAGAGSGPGGYASPLRERCILGHWYQSRISRARSRALLCACASAAIGGSPALGAPGGNGNGNAFGLSGGNGNGNAYGLASKPPVVAPVVVAPPVVTPAVVSAPNGNGSGNGVGKGGSPPGNAFGQPA